ncbi:hypothetical protein [Candidatus Phytoplasma australasiaticum]|uniref:hypothetical protein n=1 Tax=Candidatus Phytoplasma australasiaticum TaxID=2754999 RepID=UPI003D811D12
MEPVCVTIHWKPIVKASLNFLAMFWWAVVQSCIQPTFADNTLMLKRVVLVANIIGSYDIDWPHLIAKQIHEATLKMSNSIPFPCLIYRIHLMSRVEGSDQQDQLI